MLNVIHNSAFIINFVEIPDSAEPICDFIIPH